MENVSAFFFPLEKGKIIGSAERQTEMSQISGRTVAVRGVRQPPRPHPTDGDHAAERLKRLFEGAAGHVSVQQCRHLY